MSVRAFYLAALVPALLAGCAAVPPSARRAMAIPYHPSNVTVRQSKLPTNMRRVAFLPIPQSREDANQAAGAALLEPLFVTELNKRNAFEIIRVQPELLRALTGNCNWNAEDALPADFFDRLRKATDCDAVVFASLTTFQAYPPLRTGWKARLVDCTEHQTWWAIDEVFDAGLDSVAAAAESYARAALNLPNPLLADTGVLHSPRRFGQYTAYAVAHTLPGH